MTTGAHPPTKGYRTLRLPLAESASERLLTDRFAAQDRRAALYGEFAELLPEAFLWGEACYGFPEPSLKPPLLGRRLRLDPGRTVFPSAPAFGMPAMTGRPQDVDQALFVRRLHGPCGAMAHVWGPEALSWERLAQGLGRCRLGGTTVKTPEPFPQALVADAQQSGWKGARVYLATTAAQGGLLGVSVAPSASQRALEKVSGVVASAAQALEAA